MVEWKSGTNPFSHQKEGCACYIKDILRRVALTFEAESKLSIVSIAAVMAQSS